jgi:hypothetical protein
MGASRRWALLTALGCSATAMAHLAHHRFSFLQNWRCTSLVLGCKESGGNASITVASGLPASEAVLLTAAVQLLQGSTEGITANGTPRSDSMTHSGGGGGTSGGGGATSSGMHTNSLHTNSFGEQSSGPEAATSVRHIWPGLVPSYWSPALHALCRLHHELLRDDVQHTSGAGLCPTRLPNIPCGSRPQHHSCVALQTRAIAHHWRGCSL